MPKSLALPTRGNLPPMSSQTRPRGAADLSKTADPVLVPVFWHPSSASVQICTRHSTRFQSEAGRGRASQDPFGGPIDEIVIDPVTPTTLYLGSDNGERIQEY